MSETTVDLERLLDVDAVESLDGHELRGLFQHLEHVRRRVEAALAVVVGEVDHRGVYGADGHGSVNAWCRALGRWSDVECRDRIRTAGLIRSDARLREAVVSGAIGVAQTHELARVFANPRCGPQLVDVADVMIAHARTLSHHEFRIVARRWETLADIDGAHRAADEAHRDRRASVVEVGDEIHLVARCGLAQGAVIKNVFERFCDAEFSADWDATVARFGDDACYALMPRTDAQRRFDALYTMATRAATARPDAKPAEPLVNLVVDVATVHHLLGAPGDCPAPADPRQRRFETSDGTPVTPADIIAAMLWGQVRRVVIDGAGVVVNMGRRRRLFTGNARQAVLLQSSRCVVAGCGAPIRNCQADHLNEWSRHGPTDGDNGAPVCARHNRLKNTGYRVHRDPTGYWHTYRPDGTEID